MTRETESLNQGDISVIIADIDEVSKAWGNVGPGDSNENAHQITTEKQIEDFTNGPLGQLKTMIEQGQLMSDNKTKITHSLETLLHTSPGRNIEKEISSILQLLSE